ncbi:hypothetical protein O6H91_19G037500 [Diphasiastrum complanatum]|uniref:Uncharacterized protein n=1 Tax=Diphasiastrum complanatum TaxID=34168 RepID=A0ACC2AU81_DIPCM|nr:hypothetical protein O6H91_19G037500 [Diphasiastrum complanatum]
MGLSLEGAQRDLELLGLWLYLDFCPPAFQVYLLSSLFVLLSKDLAVNFMAIYYASCASGLESVLISEVKVLGEASKLSDSPAFGGVCFSTVASLETIYKLRSADNVYAFVGHFQDVPISKDSAVSYLKNLVKKIDWGPSLEILKRWKAFSDKEDTSLFYKDTPWSNSNMRFRVTCDRKCITMRKHPFTSMDAAAALGDGINSLFGWTGDMRRYDGIHWGTQATVEIVPANNSEAKKVACCDGALAPRLPWSIKLENVKDDDDSASKTCEGKVSVSLPRPSRSDSQLYSHRRYRHALIGTSLKPSIAYALLQLGDIQTGHLILDPMCGCGTIPLEAADCMAGRIACLAGDISSKAVNAARENSEEREIKGSCDVLQWDATNLALRSNCVDRVLCDMPFGIRCGSPQRREWLCPKVLREIVRVLRQDTGAAILLSHSKSMRHEIEENQRLFLQVLESLPIDMEGIRLEVLIIRRTSAPAPIQIPKNSKKLTRRQDADISN